MGRMKELTPTLPMAAAIETITPIIEKEFKEHGLEIAKMGPHSYGGLVAEARIPVERITEMRNAPFRPRHRARERAGGLGLRGLPLKEHAASPPWTSAGSCLLFCVQTYSIHGRAASRAAFHCRGIVIM